MLHLGHWLCAWTAKKVREVWCAWKYDRCAVGESVVFKWKNYSGCVWKHLRGALLLWKIFIIAMFEPWLAALAVSCWHCWSRCRAIYGRLQRFAVLARINANLMLPDKFISGELIKFCWKSLSGFIGGWKRGAWVGALTRNLLAGNLVSSQDYRDDSMTMVISGLPEGTAGAASSPQCLLAWKSKTGDAVIRRRRFP